MARTALQEIKQPTVIVPACGSSRRFKEAGILQPKGLIQFSIPAARRPVATMIEHVLDHDWIGAWDTVVATTIEDARAFGEALPNLEIIGVGNTMGQAHTVWRVIERLNLHGPILIVNCDNQIDYPLAALTQNNYYASTVLVMPGEGDTAYSYVENFPLFMTAHEKRACSPWALAGAFYFPEAQRVLQAIERQMENNARHANEFYLSEALGFMQVGKDNLAVAMPRDMLHGWGTPEDLARDPRVVIADPKINKLLELYR